MEQNEVQSGLVILTWTWDSTSGKTVFPLNIERTGPPHTKTKWNWPLTLHHAQNSAQNGLRMRIYGPQTAKLLKENVRGKLHGIGVGSEFVKETPKVQATGAKTDRRATWHQKLLHWKVNNHQLEMATGKWEKKTVNHTSTRGSSPKHTRNPYNSAAKPHRLPCWNWPKDLSRKFSKEDIDMAGKFAKQCPVSSYHQRNANQTAVSHPFLPRLYTLVRLAQSYHCMILARM